MKRKETKGKSFSSAANAAFSRVSSPVDPRRVYLLKDAPQSKGPVVYWMSRDQRVSDNWALLFAQQLALETSSPLCVLFCLAPNFLDATLRQYDFMLTGLQRVEHFLKELQIPFFLRTGAPDRSVVAFTTAVKAGAIVTDFGPLRIQREWKKQVADGIAIPFYELDAHNIVPCRLVSNKAEFAARTLRPKIHRVLKSFLTPFPPLHKHPHRWTGTMNPIDWIAAKKSLRIDRSVREVTSPKPGEDQATAVTLQFIAKRLPFYAMDRNDPNKAALSGLSPYLHFGQIAAQRVAIEVGKISVNRASREAFLEELVVRRELSDNFCFYNQNYDSFDCFPVWARRTLNAHRADRRPAIYTLKQLENAETADDLWNAAQREMVITGKMHGYMRMYWAKKILEWTESPEEAMAAAIYLNDRYSLDGRDPNGYAGIAWCIGGVHDRPWFERPIFGKIRYMSRNGCKNKFRIEDYIARMQKLVG
jgi:deoxyribodipyrimidine photo-lyase